MVEDVLPLHSEKDLHGVRLRYAKELVHHLEIGEVDIANSVINNLCHIHEHDLYQDVGKLTRELHETLNNFQNDSRFRNLMREDMPDARESLDYIIKLTEESAHNTLGAVERCMPTVAALGKQAEGIKDKWQDLLSEKATRENISTAAIELDKYLQKVISSTAQTHQELSEIMMAQSYQDITGQILQRVVSLVCEVENSLVGMLKITHQRKLEKTQDKTTPQGSGFGPSVPGIVRDDSLQNQDDVDDLLSTLGF